MSNNTIESTQLTEISDFQTLTKQAKELDIPTSTFVKTMLKLCCAHLITAKNYPARKQETLIPQNRYICHHGCIFEIIGTPTLL